MSREDLALVQEAFRRYNAGDWDGMAELYDPAAVGVGPEGWPEGRADGRDALVDQFKRIAGEGVQSRAVIEDALEGDGSVAVRFRWRVTGAASGLTEETMFSGSFRMAGGRITEVRFFWDHDDALEAAGLRE